MQVAYNYQFYVNAICHLVNRLNNIRTGLSTALIILTVLVIFEKSG